MRLGDFSKILYSRSWTYCDGMDVLGKKSVVRQETFLNRQHDVGYWMLDSFLPASKIQYLHIAEPCE